MNAVTRGVHNALRSPIRSGAIVLMLAISIGLILAMLVARSSVNTKITEVKASTASDITVAPAGFRGGFGGGDALTADQISTIAKTAHVSGTVSTLTDQMGSSDTNLTPSLELGNLGKRFQRFESSGNSGGATVQIGGGEESARPAPTPRTPVTGTTDPNGNSANSSTLNITSGSSINAGSSDLTALVGTTLATKNNLKPGSTFTAFGQTITVKGIYSTGNMFQDNGLIMPLATVQSLTQQAGAVTNVTVHVDSSENVKNVVSALTSSLGSKADVTSEADRVANSLAPLESIGSLAMGGVIAATIAGAAIILLAMIMTVRERKREIGVIKAIGGTNLKVIVQFMSEAMTLTVIGAIVGLAIGVAVSGPMTQSLVANQTSQAQTQGPGQGGQGFRRAGAFFQGGLNQASSNLRQISGTLTPQVFGIAIGITFLIAIVGSVVPAWFIARVRPAEVLRTE